MSGELSTAGRLATSVMRLERRLRQGSAGAVTASQYAALVTLSRKASSPWASWLAPKVWLLPP